MTIDELRASVEASFANDNTFDNNELGQIVSYALGTSSRSMFGTGIDAVEIEAAKALLEEAKRGLMTVQGQAGQLQAQIAQNEQLRQLAAQGQAVQPGQGQVFGVYNPAVTMSQNAAVQRQATKAIEDCQKTLGEAQRAMLDWQARVQAYTVVEQSFRNNEKWTEKLLHPFT